MFYVRVGLSFFGSMNYFMRFRFCGIKVIPFRATVPLKSGSGLGMLFVFSCA